MKKTLWFGVAVVVVYACSDDVAQMMGGALDDAGSALRDAGEQMRDAGAQMRDAGQAQAQTFPLDCSSGGFVLTNVEQKELGKVIIHQAFPDPWGTTNPPASVDGQFYAWWSIDGKVLVQCNPGVTSASIEVRP